MQSSRVAVCGTMIAVCMAQMCSCSGERSTAGPRPDSTGEDRFAHVNTIGHDRGVWQQLLSDHAAIRRRVVYTPTGVEAVTESDDPTVAARIVGHARAMHERVKVGAPVRSWDGVFVDLFARHDAVRLAVTPTERGVRIAESSDDPKVTATLWSHASGLCDFVREGHGAGSRETPRLAPGVMPPPEVAIGGVRHKFLLSQPDAKQIASMKVLGVQSIVNFRTPGEHAAYDEAGAAAGAGLGYANVPYAGAAELTDEVLDAARAALRAADGRGETVALHCRTGNRVGAAWAAYRALDSGVDVERAMGEAKGVGMVDAALESRVREYIKTHGAPNTLRP